MYVIFERYGDCWSTGNTLAEAANLWKENYDDFPDFDCVTVVKGDTVEVELKHQFIEKSKPVTKPADKKPAVKKTISK